MLQYSLDGDERCEEYMYLHPDTGAIVLKTLLDDPTVTQLDVRHLVVFILVKDMMGVSYLVIFSLEK